MAEYGQLCAMAAKSKAAFAGIPGLHPPPSFDFADPSVWPTWIEQFEDHDCSLLQDCTELKTSSWLPCYPRIGCQVHRCRRVKNKLALQVTQP